MKVNGLKPSNLNYKYLVIVLIASVSLPLYANSAKNSAANVGITSVQDTVQDTMQDSVQDATKQRSSEAVPVKNAFSVSANDVKDSKDTTTIKATGKAQNSEVKAQNNVIIIQPPAGKRLGDWLTQYLAETEQTYYESALVWQSTLEISSQQKIHNDLSNQLAELVQKNRGDNQEGLQNFSAWFASLPITGRVQLPKQDPRYLQVNPQIDPVFAAGDTIQLYKIPNTVNVLFDDTQVCRVIYEVGVSAKSYLDECQARFNKTSLADDAYLILPNGVVQHITLAKWNAQQQITPVAGSWLWVPDKSNNWEDDLAADIAHFIATQGLDLPLLDSDNDNISPITLTKTRPETSRDLPLTASDWGLTGLLQTPTARMHKQGTLVTHISHVDPYTRYNLVLQPFDWLETTVRYSNIDGVSYGKVSPDQDLKDKSLDVKLKLLKESHWFPELAVGWRDPAGTSLFGGEYLVANKRYGDFDFSLGMGWGYLGARGNIDNPLGAIGERFEERVADKKGEGGELSPKSWFTGPVSLFGGVQWHTPYDPLIIKVEYDGNNYQSEPYSNQNYNSKDMPINIGLTWQDTVRGMALSAGYERGDTLMLGLTLQGDLSALGQVKPRASQVQQMDNIPTTEYSSLKYRINLNTAAEGSSKNAELLNAISQATGWRATELAINDGQALLKVEDYNGVFINERLQQGMQILRQVLPADTQSVQIVVSRNGEAVAVFDIDASNWAQQYLQLLPPSQRQDTAITVTSASNNSISNNGEPNAQPLINLAYIKPPKGSITFSPSIQQSIGGPDGYLFGIFANANANYQLWQGSWIDGSAQLRLLDNFDNYHFSGHSKLPRVRTHIGEYMTTSRLLLPQLQWNQFKSFSDNWYGLLYAGYLDPMFAGVGAEVLYRQPNSPWAIGADMNRVRQRDFDQRFGLQDYEVTTGHISLYWDMPWYDVDMKLSAGQYLAGDKGVTVDLSRQFSNGVKMGGWLTKTDVSSEEFGEGSMDKGIYVSIPFDVLFRQWSSGNATLVYQPLIRDGGAKLNYKNQLIDITAPLHQSTLEIKNPAAD